MRRWKKIILLLAAFAFAALAWSFPVTKAYIPIEADQAAQGSVNYAANGQQSMNVFVGGVPVNAQSKCKSASGTSNGNQPTSTTGLVAGWGVLVTTGFTVDTNCNVTLGGPQPGQQVAYVSPGALGTATSLIAQVSYPKGISSATYVADLINTMHNPLGAQTAYAQGLGFSSLEPVLGLWKIFRNVAYFFFVVIFLFIGFAIMLRSKIGGQAAVTIQQALPKLVVSLLLVTFSYAIAGLAIDIMYLVIYLLIGIFSSTSSQLPAMTTSSLTTIALQNNLFVNMVSLITNGVVGQVAGALGNMVAGILSQFSTLPIITNAVQGAVNVIATLVLAIALLVSMFRLFFALIKAYAGVFISVIFAPIQLLIGALPGQNTFQTWFMGLIENLAVFPTVILLLFVGYYLFNLGGGNAGQIQNGIGGFSAPQLGSNQGATGGPIALAMLEFGIISMIPSAVDLAKKAVHGKLDVNVAEGAGKFLSSGWKGGELIPGVGISRIPGIGGGGLGGFTAYKDAKNTLIGTDAYRKRQQELMILSGKQNIPQYGGLVGVVDHFRRKGPVTTEQVEAARRQRQQAEERIAAGQSQPSNAGKGNPKNTGDYV